MERLTEKHYGGKGYYMTCSGVLRCNGTCGDCEELEKVVDRLGEFEDKAEQKPQTNADRIRSMSDEELAKLLLEADQGNFTVDVCDEKYCVPESHKCPHDCTAAAIKWLQSPVKESGQ